MDNTSNITCVDDDYCDWDDARFYKEILNFVYPKPREWFLICLFVIVFFLGICGNFLVCYAVWRNRQLRTVTNYFLVNLSTADFMVILLCLPSTLVHNVLESWLLGEAMCKLLTYLQDVSVLVSVLTLTAISIERYTAICHPLSHRISRSKTILVIVSIWIISLACASPDIVFMAVIPDSKIPANIILLRACKPQESRPTFIHQMALVCLFFVLPVHIMGFAYIRIAKCLWESTKKGPALTGNSNSHATVMQNRTRKKTAKMLIVVVIVFIICYLPVYLLNILRYVRVIHSVSHNKWLKTVTLVSHWLCYFNSSVNPIIYNFMSDKFRKEFRVVCSCLRFDVCSKCGVSISCKDSRDLRRLPLSARDGISRTKETSDSGAEQTEMLRMRPMENSLK